MQYAIFTVSLPEYSPAEALKEIKAAGYDGVEWRVTDQKQSSDGKPSFWAGNKCTWPLASFPTDAARIRAMTEAAGLAMPSMGTYVSCGDLAAVETAMQMEIKSRDYYKEQGAKSTAADAGKFFAALAAEEHGHYLYLVDYKEYITDPADWFTHSEHHLLDGA